MAIAVLIDLSNYDSMLVQSTDSRAGTPDGNVYFDTTNGKLEYITKQELAQVDLHGGISTGAIQINVVATAGTFTRLAGSFITDGFVAGRSFASSVFTEGGNNGTFVIDTVTALVITVIDNTGLVDETGGGDEIIASVAEDNPLDETLGIKFEASYAFENQERRVDETLRAFNRFTEGTFKFGGAYNYVNGRTPSTVADVAIHRGSGWNELDISGVIQKIYFGNKGLSNIDSGSQPYYMLSDLAVPVLNDIVPVDFAKLGQIDEAVLVYENSVSDTRAYEAVSIRTFQNNYDRKDTVNDLGIAELGGYSTGFAVNESEHLTTKNYTLADVYGGAIIAPWDTMGLEELDTPVVIGGFNEADGTFTWVLNNPGTGTNGSPVSQANLDECVAFLDALAQTDDDINDHASNTTHGKRVETWYSYNATGQILTKSGADDNGLYIYNIPTANEQDIYFTDDAGGIKTQPFSVELEANLGATAKADALAWYHSYFEAAYNTGGAIEVQDATPEVIKGLASTADAENKIKRAFDYDGDSVGGSPGTDKDCVWLCEGDGGATQAKTLYTIKRQTTVAFACIPSVENNV